MSWPSIKAISARYSNCYELCESSLPGEASMLKMILKVLSAVQMIRICLLLITQQGFSFSFLLDA